jgi:predicted MPP superfamily phosphohydrolase
MPVRPVSRRAFLVAAGGAAVTVAAAGTDAFIWAPRRVQFNRHDVPVPDLPLPLQGLTIAHLSDIHLYDGMHAAARRSMALVAESKPDVTVITGDLVENQQQLTELVPFLAACRGRLATVVTMGNWEIQVGVTPGLLRRVCSAASVRLLYNEAELVRVGGAALALVGLDDPRAGIPDPERALRGVPSDAVPIWGFHAPGYADQLMNRPYQRPPLILSGHTHGGQIRPPFLPAITPPASGRFVSGWYRDTFAPLFVSRGIGTSGIRARFRCPPEVGLFTLRSAPTSSP